MQEYFPHDFNASSDPKMVALIDEFGAIGYGIYWYIIELLHKEESHKLPNKQYIYIAIAKQMQANAKQINLDAEQVENIVKHCILVCDLFVSDGDFFYSNRVIKNFEKRAELSEKRSLAGKAGAIAKQNLANTSKEKKKKVNKIKEKEIKELIPKHLVDVFLKFIEMRKKIKKPMTENAIELAIKKLSEMTPDQNEQIKIVENSIVNSWQGLFPLKDPVKTEQTSLPFKIVRPNPMGLSGKALEEYYAGKFDPEKDYGD